MHNNNHIVLPNGMQIDTIVVQINIDSNNIRTIGLSQMQENINNTSALTGIAYIKLSQAIGVSGEASLSVTKTIVDISQTIPADIRDINKCFHF